MGAITVRNIPDEVHLALKAQAAQNGRSTEAEIRVILENAVLPKQREKLGDRIRKIARKYNFPEFELPPRTEEHNFEELF